MVIALSVDRMGGILSVIWVVGAVTGGAMFIPMLWALFSKHHTGKSVLGTTLICLVVNSFFKWGGVYVLTQAQSQALGVLLPLSLMGGIEIYSRLRTPISQQFLDYEKGRLERESSEQDTDANQEENREAQKENVHGIKVICLGVLSTGLLITILGVLAETGTLLVSSGLETKEADILPSKVVQS